MWHYAREGTGRPRGMGVRNPSPWVCLWRADASCEGGADDIRGEEWDRHESRPSLDVVRAFGWRGPGSLQGLWRGTRIPREPVQPVPARSGQETPDGPPELASPTPERPEVARRPSVLRGLRPQIEAPRAPCHVALIARLTFAPDGCVLRPLPLPLAPRFIPFPVAAASLLPSPLHPLPP